MWLPLAAAAEPVTFTLTDHLSTGQVQEDIAVFFAGHLSASLHVDRDRPDDRAEISLTASDSYDFALCGRLVRDSGSPPEHRIDDGGTLTDVAGRVFGAFTIDDTLFTLEDVTPDREKVPVTARPGPVCAPTVAAR